MNANKITLGFIGCGNMAGAIINGVVANGVLNANSIGYYDPYCEKGIDGTVSFNSSEDLVNASQYVILAVKPSVIDVCLKEIKTVCDNKPIGSIAAGVTMAHIKEFIPKGRLIRIMPNTCAAIGKSYTVLSSDHSLNDDEYKMFEDIFTAVGKVQAVKEEYFNVCAAVCSCGVAFGHMLVESMADGGVLCGMSKEKSVEMAAYAIEGACSMIMASQEGPAKLKDKICSPGGMTAKAMQALENGGFRSSVIDAVEAAYEKGKQL